MIEQRTSARIDLLARECLEHFKRWPFVVLIRYRIEADTHRDGWKRDEAAYEAAEEMTRAFVRKWLHATWSPENSIVRDVSDTDDVIRRACEIIRTEPRKDDLSD